MARRPSLSRVTLCPTCNRRWTSDGRKLLTAGRLDREGKIKPIFARADDFQLRRYPFDAACDMLEPAADGNLPFLLQLRKITREKAQDRVLTSQQIFAGRGWPGKPGILNAAEAITLKRKISGVHRLPLLVHKRFGRRGHSEGHHPLAIPALNLRRRVD